MLRVRLANITDRQNVFDLSNDDIVRQNSINKNKILWENHVKWFDERIKNVEEPFFIVENEKNDFVAQVRFDKKEYNLISISISSKYRGKGLASYIIRVCSEKSGLSPVVAYVKQENISSLKAFKKAGYNEVDKILIDNQTYVRLSF